MERSRYMEYFNRRNGHTKIGKGIISLECENVHLINELDIPVSVVGVSNVVVAVSPDGILVSDKEESPRVKEIVVNLTTDLCMKNVVGAGIVYWIILKLMMDMKC